jgi:signal transduction histidine kinase
MHATATPGLSDSSGWRVFGSALGSSGRMLYVAHRLSERSEAHTEVALSAALAALSIGLLGHVWLRARVRDELRPLERMSERLAHLDPLDHAHTLGVAERAELEPVHGAIDDLGRRLAQRVMHERAFSAHAAHALRTPLAGMDAQLAVAQRECPPSLLPRLQRVREASARLQRVVRALLDLFRAGGEVQRSAIDLPFLLAHLPVEGLEVEVQAQHALSADADLLTAALANLLDNARRHGARHLHVSTPRPNTVRLADDGPGIASDRLRTLRAALVTQSYEAPAGLGLMLADLVVRSHGGSLTLPDAQSGFVVELSLG